MWYITSDTPNNETFRSESTTRITGVPLLGRFRDFPSTGGALLAEVNLPTMKKTIAALAAALFLFPSVSMAAGLNYQQASSIIVLLEAFGVNSTTINTVWGFIAPADTPLSPPTVASTQNQEPAYQAPLGGVIQAPTQTPVQVASTIDYNNPGVMSYIVDASQLISGMQNAIITTGCTSGLSLPALTAAKCKYQAQIISAVQTDITQANQLQTIQLSSTCDSGLGEHLDDLLKARDQYYNIEVALAGASINGVSQSEVNSLNAQAISEISNIGSIQAEIQANIGACS